MMDATTILQSKRRKVDLTPAFEIPVTLDLALLAVYNSNLLNEDAYIADREDYLKGHARDNVQLLINSIFNRPTTVNADGIMASLPMEPLTILPREKPLPKPKPPTKWERFAAKKGIVSKSKKERMTFDEDKQSWVPTYGYKGKNRETEDQWLVEVPANKPADFDPRAKAREERQTRKTKNEKDQKRNVDMAAAKSQSSTANALSRASRKSAIERDLVSAKRATASMGKFDKTLPGEERVVGSRPKGQKRKFDANEMGADSERQKEMKVLKSLEGKNRADKGDVLNARKAVRQINGGRGASIGGARKPSRGKR